MLEGVAIYGLTNEPTVAMVDHVDPARPLVDNDSNMWEGLAAHHRDLTESARTRFHDAMRNEYAHASIATLAPYLCKYNIACPSMEDLLCGRLALNNRHLKAGCKRARHRSISCGSHTYCTSSSTPRGFTCHSCGSLCTTRRTHVATHKSSASWQGRAEGFSMRDLQAQPSSCIKADHLFFWRVTFARMHCSRFNTLGSYTTMNPSIVRPYPSTVNERYE